MPYSFYDVTDDLISALYNEIAPADAPFGEETHEWMGAEGNPTITIPKSRWMDLLKETMGYIEFLDHVQRLEARVIMGAHWVSDDNFVIIEFPHDTPLAEMTWMKLRFG